MIVTHDARDLVPLEGPLVVSLGVFDGVHRGHQAVFETLRRETDRLGAVGLIVTLDPHPLAIVRPGSAPPLLTLPAERTARLARWATGGVLVQRFDRETAGLSASEFLGRIVPARARLVSLVVGYDFRMGRHRSGGVEELREEGERHGWSVVRVDSILENDHPISSSRIRGLVAEGRVAEAAVLLGHPYSLQGRVVPGRGVGRTLSFPTANVDVGDVRKLLPRFGVYAVRVRIVGGEGIIEPRPGVANVGVRPTFGEDRGEATVEVHLPGWEGSLEGRELGLEVVERIRDEQAFPGPEELAARIAEDVVRARNILKERG